MPLKRPKLPLVTSLILAAPALLLLVLLIAAEPLLGSLISLATLWAFLPGLFRPSFWRKILRR